MPTAPRQQRARPSVRDRLIALSETDHPVLGGPGPRQIRGWRVLLACGPLAPLAVLSPRTAVVAVMLRLVFAGERWDAVRALAKRVTAGPWPAPIISAGASAAGALYTAEQQPQALLYVLASAPLALQLSVARVTLGEWAGSRLRLRTARLPFGH